MTKSILITGGTGSFGRKFIEHLISHENEWDRIVIFSRDELKQWEMQNIFPSEKFGKLRYFLGDIRDYQRLKEHVKAYILLYMLLHLNKFLLQNIILQSLLKQILLVLRILSKQQRIAE